jgi:hypothetical protein
MRRSSVASPVRWRVDSRAVPSIGVVELLGLLLGLLVPAVILAAIVIVVYRVIRRT